MAFEFTRFSENPILKPRLDVSWEAFATFNPCVVSAKKKKFHLLYRAMAKPTDYEGSHFALSSIAYADSEDGIHFANRRQFIAPEKDWEKFGCEDPRITYLNGKYYIFYTALSCYPFSAKCIRVGLAITKDFQTIEEKHFITPFNAKAMTLFPEKINGKMLGILTAHTDMPPSKIALAYFDNESDMWSDEYWKHWYKSLDSHVIPFLRHSGDQVEVGAPPIKTEKGWLLILSYIQNYFSPERIFRVEAVLLDLHDPSKVLARTLHQILVPEKSYEMLGTVPDIVFPSGILLEKGILSLYYGAADTLCCVATCPLDKLLEQMHFEDETCDLIPSMGPHKGFDRYKHNPILCPRPEFTWEAAGCFNPAVVYEKDRFHIVYRAMSSNNTSVFGYASSKDGFHIDERSREPIYVPREKFESRLGSGGSGCEDPRITKLDDKFYIFYTAYDGYTPRVAFSSIKVEDFLNKQWNWSDAKVISPPGVDDKDACLFPKKINDRFVVVHRVKGRICINLEDDLDFGGNKWLIDKQTLLSSRKEYVENIKYGVAAPPIETKDGWIFLYHRVSFPGAVYKVEAALVDLNDPTKLLAHTDDALLEPLMDYEKVGIVPNVVFPCGAVLLKEKIYLYYGGADRVCCIAVMKLGDLMKRLGT